MTKQENKLVMLQRAKELLASKNLDDFSTEDLPKLIYNLRVHQIELEMQNEELRRLQMELEESRNEYADLYNFAPVGYFTLNKNTLILGVNFAGAALLGTERSHLVNKRFSYYIAKENQDAFYFYRKRLVETKSRQSCELKMLKDNGTLFYAQLNGIAVFDAVGNLSQYRLAVLDITQRKQGEIILQENLAQLSKMRRYESIVSSISQNVHRSIDLKEVMKSAVETLHENIEDTDFVSIYMVEGNEAVLKAQKGFPDQYVQRAGRIPYGRGATWKTLIEGTTIYTPNVEQDTVLGPAGRDIGTKSYLSAPLHFEGKAIGTLNINSLSKDAFDEEELKLLEVVVKQIEIAISNAHHAELLRVSRENYKNLFENVPLGIYRTTPDGRIIMANPALINILGYSSFDELASHNLKDEEFSAKYPRAKFKETIEREGEVRGLESVWIKKDGSSLHVSENAKAIRGEDGVVLYYEGTVEDITERKKADELLQENLTKLDKKNRYESIISSITQSIHSSINLQEVLDNAVDAMIKNIDGVDQAFISLVEDKEVLLKAYRGHPTWFIEQVRKIPYPEGATWETIKEGKSKYVADTDKDTVEDPPGIEAGTKSYLSIPLQLEGKTIGVININSFKKDAFEEEELKLLEIISKQIETAINNARQAEELRESREKFRLLVEGVKDYAIFMLDVEGYIVSWNTGAKRINGYEQEEVIGKHFSIFYSTEDVERGKPEYKLKIAREESRVEDEGWRIRKDGTRFWANAIITTLRDEYGKLRGFAKVTRDITERRQAEELLNKSKEELEMRVVKRTKELAESNENLKKEITWHKWAEDMLRNSEERYRALYDENPSIYFTVNGEGKILSVNQFGAERLGFSTHELIGQSILNIIHEADKKAALDNIIDCFQNKGKVVGWELRKVSNKDRRIVWVQEAARAVQSTDGSTSVLIVAQDISDRKRMEDILYRHSQILDLANDTILIRDTQDKIIYWNQGAEWTYGWTKEEAVGRNVHELLQTEFTEPLEIIREKLFSEEYWEGEAIHTKHDGTSIIVHSRWTLQSATETNPAVILEINNDITERKQVEEALRDSQERFSSFMRHLPGAAWIKDVDGRYVYANEIAQKIFDKTLDNLVGKTDDEVFDTDTASQFKENDQIAISSRQSFQTIEMLPQPDGFHYSLVSKFPIFDKNDIPNLVGGIAIDITERMRAEEALRESEAKLAEELADMKQLQNISSQLIQEDNINVLYDQILDAAIALMGSDMGSLQMLYPEKNELLLLAWKGFNPASAAFWEWVRVDSGSSCGVALHTGERVIVPDAETCDFMAGTDNLDFYRLSGIKAMQSTPLVSRGGHIVGMISTHWREPHQPSERDLGLLDVLARQAADLIERKQAEEALRRTMKFNETLMSNMGEGLYTVDSQGLVTSMNPAAEKLFGWTFDDLRGRKMHDLTHYKRPDGTPFPLEDCAGLQVLHKGETLINHEDVFIRKDGTFFDVLYSSSPLWENGEITGLVVVFLDITERKMAEEKIKASLEEKEILLKEIHHRVKNNLQIIYSLLSMQSRRIKDKEILKELNDTQSRVKTMSLIHEKLYQSENLSAVDFSKYIKSLSKYLVHSYETDSSSNIKLKISANNVFLPVDKAVPCGLILNELISNSLKHAFPPGKDGEIRISIHPDNGSKKSMELYTLIIGNNGVEFPKDLDFRDAKSLGLQLVCSLTQQLKGTIELDTGSGTEFRITFPV